MPDHAIVEEDVPAPEPERMSAVRTMVPAVGFSGTFIVARADRPLTDLASMQGSGCVPEWWARDGAWQILQASLGGDPRSSIVSETQAPVLVAHVLHSDFVTVQAAGPSGLFWQCALSPVMARDYGFPEKWIGDADTVFRQACLWAREAGLRPDPSALRAALVAEGDPLAEALVFDLTQALGFRFDGGAPLDPSVTGS
ncbi:hypothetical protein [Embleya sp. NPDC059259]|uniref:hypothetical protein n=1 Tax=unclassified Embleya TaxID=2699296 RepID=UPI0036A17005